MKLFALDLTILKRMLPYLLLCVLGFYLTPLVGKDTGGFMALLLIVVPVLCLIFSFIYGIRYGFNLFFPIFVALLCLPAVFLLFNASAWIYAPAYGILTLIGDGLGSLCRRMRKQ